MRPLERSSEVLLQRGGKIKMGICHQLYYLAPQRDAMKETNQSGDHGCHSVHFATRHRKFLAAEQEWTEKMEATKRLKCQCCSVELVVSFGFWREKEKEDESRTYNTCRVLCTMPQIMPYLYLMHMHRSGTKSVGKKHLVMNKLKFKPALSVPSESSRVRSAQLEHRHCSSTQPIWTRGSTQGCKATSCGSVQQVHDQNAAVVLKFSTSGQLPHAWIIAGMGEILLT
ncbi:uncharacterized protein LOC125692881 [Lagopus muta]|uniref:uncharacterized protein LOC125692881 n=1 Tax=Lagopus muta TaxID=64668 RepID=UPI00209F4DAD|nr:uncharacterized protein LOC125692881 [Lagopus muta]XP_048799988.1 uncharacterized protein LOC125692881 [Lagopus muta]XP_048799990.1 uncharacterized protein LOC125692881 [Lagopus muta]